MRKRKNTQEFNQEIKELTNNEFELEGEYKNKTTKVSIKHLGCNQSFAIFPSQFLQELKCKKCGKEIDLFERYNINSSKDYKDFIYNKTNDFKILSDFINENTRIKVVHNKCNHEQDVDPKKFLHNQICQVCDGGLQVDFYDFVAKVYDKYLYEYVVLSRNKNDFKFIHTKCGTEFEMKSKLFLKDQSPCPECDKKNKWNIRTAKKEISKCFNGEFKCIDDSFKTVDTLLKIVHNICGEEFSMSLNAFLKTPKCPICEKGISLGEKIVGKILNKFNLDFKREYSIDECKSTNTLRFDFGIIKDSMLLCLIEYDGEGHYFPLYDNEGTRNLVQVRERDKIKNKYCIDNNIFLIRIPFWELNNVEKYLKKELKKINII